MSVHCAGSSGEATSDATSQASTTSTTSTTSANDDATTSTEAGDTTGSPELGCNGAVALCDRPFDQVVLPGTHNANSALSEGYSLINANHRDGIGPQLEFGVRAMLIDVTMHEGETTLCHGPCSLGSQPHIEALAVIRAFMEAHPREVLMIIYQDDISAEAMEADFEESGLAALVYTHQPGASWPTLQQMIDDGTRLVVTAESGGPPPAWYHHAWALVWDTPYSFMSADEFSCELNRGNTDNPLFLINHWVNNELDLPSEGERGDRQPVRRALRAGRSSACARQAGSRT